MDMALKEAALQAPGSKSTLYTNICQFNDVF